MSAEQTEITETAQFCATVGRSRGLVTTPSKAANNLLGHSGNAIPIPIVIWPYNRSDEYWLEAQQQRLLDLRSRSETLTVAEREEWEHLAEATLEAATLRSQAALGTEYGVTFIRLSPHGWISAVNTAVRRS